MHLTVTIDGQPRFRDRQGHRFQPVQLPAELPQLPGLAPEPQHEPEAMAAEPQHDPAPAPAPAQPDQGPQPPPQYPQHVYREVVLPPATQVQIDGLVRDVADLRRDTQHLRLLLGWLIDRERDRAQAQGIVLPDVPAPPDQQQ